MAATLQPCSLTANHLPHSKNTSTSTHYQHTLSPPNLNFQNFISKTHAIAKNSKPTTQKNPNPESAPALRMTKGFAFSPFFEPNDDIVNYSLSFLRLFTSKNSRIRNPEQFHGQFVKMGVLNSGSFIQNKLIVMYSRDEDRLGYARTLFDEIPERDVRVYVSLMGSYCRSEKWVEMFEVFNLMVKDELQPDKYLIPTILKACSALKLMRTGKMVHGFTFRNKMWSDIFVGNSLVDFYSNCGDLRYSRNVFDTMQERDVVTWTAIVSAFMNEGYVDEAMNYFNSMEINGVNPDLISWNALISGFARNGNIDSALRYLEEIQEKGLELQVSSWNGVISGCVENGFYEDALDVFHEMIRSPERPNAVTIVSVLTACASLKFVDLGRAIHGYSIKRKFQRNIHFEGSLINMYSKCGMINCCDRVFVLAEEKNTTLWNEMVAAYVNEGKIDAALGLVKLMQNGDLEPDEITYNTILSGYARNGKKNEAYNILTEMTEMCVKPSIVSFNIILSGFQQYGLSREALDVYRNIQPPNPVSITGALAACADLALLNRGKEIHGYITKSNFGANIFVSSALVDMYAKCKDMRSATEIFSKLEDRNAVSWNSMIAGHIKNENVEEGLAQFTAMLFDGFIPTVVTFMILLQVCGDIKALSLGRALHGLIVKGRWDIEQYDTLYRALVNMYAKCGCPRDGKFVSD